MSPALRTAFTPAEVRAIKRLKDPHGIQRFLDEIPYHHATTAFSPRQVLAQRTAHCLEGAVFAAAALRVLGFRPLVWDLEAEQDTDHVIAIYRTNGSWGAIAASNYASCRGRAPIYRSLRELALTYFEGYFNMRRELSMRAYSRPVDLSRFDHRQWEIADDVWFVAEHLCDIPHTQLLTRKQIQSLRRVDQRTMASGMYGYRKK